MQIRPYTPADLRAIVDIHKRSGLPANCLPDLSNPLFRVKIVADHAGKVAQAGFVKMVGEAFVIVDHEILNPGERLDALERLIVSGLHEASTICDEVSAWLPPEVEKSFGPRLESLGFRKSPWRSYTALLR